MASSISMLGLENMAKETRKMPMEARRGDMILRRTGHRWSSGRALVERWGSRWTYE